MSRRRTVRIPMSATGITIPHEIVEDLWRVEAVHTDLKWHEKFPDVGRTPIDFDHAPFYAKSFLDAQVKARERVSCEDWGWITRIDVVELTRDEARRHVDQRAALGERDALQGLNGSHPPTQAIRGSRKKN